MDIREGVGKCSYTRAARFMITDRPQTIVCAFNLSLSTDNLVAFRDLAIDRDVILNNPCVRVARCK